MSEPFEALSEQVIANLEKVGLYVEGVTVGGFPRSEEVVEQLTSGEISEREAMDQGLVEFQLLIGARIGNVAWSDRVQNPEGFAERKAFEMVVPSEKEISLEEIRRDLEDLDDAG